MDQATLLALTSFILCFYNFFRWQSFRRRLFKVNPGYDTVNDLLQHPTQGKFRFQKLSGPGFFGQFHIGLLKCFDPVLQGTVIRRILQTVDLRPVFIHPFLQFRVTLERGKLSAIMPSP